MNIYVYNLVKFIKQLGQYYYMTSDKIEINIRNKYYVYIICINKKTKKYIVFKFIIEKFDINILYIIKKYIKKKNKFLNNNK